MGVFEMKFIDILRKLKPLNVLENIGLTSEFNKEVLKRKEINSKIVFTHYYVPLAIKTILTREGYLKSLSDYQVNNLATALLLRDLSDGTLTEFYKFKESEV